MRSLCIKPLSGHAAVRLMQTYQSAGQLLLQNQFERMYCRTRTGSAGCRHMTQESVFL